MTLNISFSNHGDQVRITHEGNSGRVENNWNHVDSDYQVVLRCLLLSPCREECEHKAPETIQITLSDEGERWFVELLVLTLRHSNDMKQRLHAAALLGMIGGHQAETELMRLLGNQCADLHWAAVASLKHLGCGHLLAEWNYR